jgi:hypothetical protein
MGHMRHGHHRSTEPSLRQAKLSVEGCAEPRRTRWANDVSMQASGAFGAASLVPAKQTPLDHRVDRTSPRTSVTTTARRTFQNQVARAAARDGRITHYEHRPEPERTRRRARRATVMHDVGREARRSSMARTGWMPAMPSRHSPGSPGVGGSSAATLSGALAQATITTVTHAGDGSRRRVDRGASLRRTRCSWPCREWCR